MIKLKDKHIQLKDEETGIGAFHKKNYTEKREIVTGRQLLIHNMHAVYICFYRLSVDE